MAEEISIELLPELSNSRRWKRWISEDGARGKRERLHRALDIAWFQIGWRLERLKHREQVPNIFTIRKHHTDDPVLAFFELTLCDPDVAEIEDWISECGTRETASRLQAIRRAVSEQPEIISSFSKQAKTDATSLKNLERSLSKESFAQHRDAVLRTTISLTAEIKHVLQRRFELCAELKYAKMLQPIAEAYFAQSELVDFCKSSRYKLSPVSVANAVALLPYTGWRESTTVCRPWPLPHGQNYELLKLIRRFLSQCDVTIGFSTNILLVLDATDKWLRKIAGGKSTAVADLLNNKEHFGRAVRKVHTRKVSRSYRPYAIARAYRRSIRSASPLDRLFEEVDHVLKNRETFAPKPFKIEK